METSSVDAGKANERLADARSTAPAKDFRRMSVAVSDSDGRRSLDPRSDVKTMQL